MYWLPLNGSGAVIASIVLRIVVKAVVDFTGNLHYRHPYDHGGFYWSLNLLFSQLSVLGATIFYTNPADAEQASIRSANSSTIWVVIGSISALWFFSFTAFIFLIKSQYIKTFFALKTGNDQTRENWNCKGDEGKKLRAVMNNCPYKWRSIRDEVKEWVQANWYRWEQEQPDWWTDALKGSIPDDMLPAPALKEEKKKGGGERRRSSLRNVMELTGGSAEVVPASK